MQVYVLRELTPKRQPHPINPFYATYNKLCFAVGCILGFSIVYAGSGGVLWYVPDPASFPPYKGFVPIVVAWFFSPIFCATSSAIIFSSLKFTILRKEWGYKASVWLLPFFVYVVFLCCIYFVFTKVWKGQQLQPRQSVLLKYFRLRLLEHVCTCHDPQFAST